VEKHQEGRRKTERRQEYSVSSSHRIEKRLRNELKGSGVDEEGNQRTLRQQQFTSEEEKFVVRK
jgi:hypothetical protein